jgi:hypothetical protein
MKSSTYDESSGMPAEAKKALCGSVSAKMSLRERWEAWRKRRYWTAERQLENLRNMIYSDHRWLAHDKTADAITTRYVAALAPDWYKRVHTDSCHFRKEIGLEPVHAFSAFGGPEHMARLQRWVRGDAPYNEGPLIERGWD